MTLTAKTGPCSSDIVSNLDFIAQRWSGEIITNIAHAQTGTVTRSNLELNQSITHSRPTTNKATEHCPSNTGGEKGWQTTSIANLGSYQGCIHASGDNKGTSIAHLCHLKELILVAWGPRMPQNSRKPGAGSTCAQCFLCKSDRPKGRLYTKLMPQDRHFALKRRSNGL